VQVQATGYGFGKPAQQPAEQLVVELPFQIAGDAALCLPYAAASISHTGHEQGPIQGLL
jgi:hypothetical protein